MELGKETTDLVLQYFDAVIHRDQSMNNYDVLAQQLGKALSHKCNTTWTTAGHTGVDVNLYAFGPGQDHLRGSLDNTAIGQVIADMLGLNLSASQIQLLKQTLPH